MIKLIWKCKAIALFVGIVMLASAAYGQTTSTVAGSDGLWNTAANWNNGVPASGGIANINKALTLNTNISITGGGTYTINSPVTDAAGSTAYTLTISGSGTNGVLDVNANTTFEGAANINSKGSLIVESGVTLIVGAATFANNSIVNVKAGGTLIINGNLTNNNNSNNITIDGNLIINGSFTGGNGSAVIGGGTMTTTGGMTNTGSGTVFGTGANCSTGPCSSSPLCTSPSVPILTQGNSLTFCKGTIVPLEALASGTNLLWYTSATGGTGASSFTVSTASAGTQNLWVTQTVSGCESSRVPLTITISNTSGTMDIYSTITDGCAGTNLTLFTLSGAFNSNFNWSGPNGFSSTNSVAVTVSNSATAAMSGTYYVTSTAFLTTCLVANSIDVVVSATTPLSAPTASAATAITSCAFDANWSAVTGTSGATSYELDVSTSTTFASFVAGYNALNVGNVTTYSVTGLSAGTTYYYRVRAKNGCGVGASSNRITAVTSALAGPTATAGSGATACQITANWNAAAGATSYQLDVSTVNTFASFVAGYNSLDVGNVTTYNVTGLAAGTTYYYRVRTVNTCGASSNSGTITYATTAALAAPTIAAASNISCNQFNAN